ncbi:hypothetical protein G9A89_010455 [Geosiphon pyriformis]|nr:hypothetical protein G9A89_010455 [Geosiphon pyriformis]
MEENKRITRFHNPRPLGDSLSPTLDLTFFELGNASISYESLHKNHLQSGLKEKPINTTISFLSASSKVTTEHFVEDNRKKSSAGNSNLNSFTARKLPDQKETQIIENLRLYNERFGSHPLFPILMELLNFRDNFYTSVNVSKFLSNLLKLTDEMDLLIPKGGKTQLDFEILAIMSSLSEKIIELCNQQNEIIDELVGSHSRFAETTINLLRIPSENFRKELKKDLKKTRDRIDPETTLWLIKYLLDNNLRKPDKKQRYLLSLWTHVSEQDIDRWYIRTSLNYLKKTETEKAHEALLYRAIKYGRQLGKARITKLTGTQSTSNGPVRSNRGKAKSVRIRGSAQV